MRLSERIFGNMGFHPRNGCSDGYPFDLDASLRFVRPANGVDKFPTPNNRGSFAKLGSMNALTPLMDTIWYQSAFAKPSWGPIMSAIPDNLQWQITIPGLNKYMPQSS